MIFNKIVSRLTWVIVVAVLLAGNVYAATLHQVAGYRLDGVKGRIDHLAYDPDNHRLFIAALGNNTVEVIDTVSGKRIRTIVGQKEPQGLSWCGDQGILVVAAGEAGTVDFFDGKTLARLKRVNGYDDADNVRYDNEAKKIVVGWGRGALTWFSLDGSVQATVRLPAHPESFQLIHKSSKLLVNVPGAGRVFVIDPGAHKITGEWQLHDAAANYPMCIDPTGTYAFIACRQPAQVITFDIAKGTEIGRVSSSADADDIFYDPERKRLYESCGEGFIDIFQDDGSGHLHRLEQQPTAHGARTSLYVDELKKVFLAIPAGPNQRCEIRVFDVD